MRTRIDPLIKPLVVNLNRLPGITTNGSCQGHLDQRKPYVSLICEEQSMWPILAAVETINGEERRQIRAYVEILSYEGSTLFVVLRFHHLMVQVKPLRATVREWHRRIRVMNDLIAAEVETGALSDLRVARALHALDFDELHSRHAASVVAGYPLSQSNVGARRRQVTVHPGDGSGSAQRH